MAEELRKALRLASVKCHASGFDPRSVAPELNLLGLISESEYEKLSSATGRNSAAICFFHHILPQKTTETLRSIISLLDDVSNYYTLLIKRCPRPETFRNAY